MSDATTVTAFYEAYNRHDAKAAAALYASDGRHIEAHNGQAREGRAALEAGLGRFFTMLDGLRFEEVKRIHSGANVLVEYVMHGTMTRDLGPMTARGQEIALPGVHVFAFENGEIASTTDYWDPREFGRQAS